MPPALFIISLPVILRGLGHEGFGIYALASAVAVFGGVASLGTADIATRAVAQLGREDRDLRRGLWSTLAAGGGPSVVIGALLAALSPLLADLLPGTSPATQSAATAAFAAAGLLLVVRAVDGAFHGALGGCGRFDLAVRASIPANAAAALGCILVASHGQPWLLLLVQTAATAAAALVKAVLLARGPMPGALRLQWPSRADLGEAWRFGLLNGAQGLGSLLQSQADRLLLGWLAGPEALTPYAIAVMLAQHVHVAAARAAAAYFPTAANASGSPDEGGYLRALRLIATVAIALALPAIVFGHPILSLWLGPAAAEASAGLLAILCAVSAVSACSAVPSYALNATGGERVNTIIGWVVAVAAVIAAAVAIPLWGAWGAAAARIAACLPLLWALGIADRRLAGDGRLPAVRTLLATVVALAPITAVMLCLPAIGGGAYALIAAAMLALLAGGATWWLAGMILRDRSRTALAGAEAAVGAKLG